MEEPLQDTDSEPSTATNPTQGELPAGITTTIDDLPNEMLDFIFSFLDAAERVRLEVVCKKWHQVGKCPNELKLDDKFLPSRKMDDALLCSVLSHSGLALKNLSLKRSRILTGESLSKIGQYCPNLVGLDLNLVDIHQIGYLKAIAPDCTKLKALRVELHKDFSLDENLTFPFDNYRNFYETCNDSFNEGLLAIAQNCKELERLHVRCLLNVDLMWLEVINPNIQSFIMKNVGSRFTNSGFTPEGMECVMRHCTTLRTFTLVDCRYITQTALIQLLSHFSRTLTSVTVSYVHDHDIYLDWCSTIRELVNLTSLHLESCELVTDELMSVVAKNCIKLRLLKISGTEVTDLGLLHLLELPDLKVLGLSYHFERRGINGYGLEALLQKGVLRQVTIWHRFPRDLHLHLTALYPNVHFIVIGPGAVKIS